MASEHEHGESPREDRRTNRREVNELLEKRRELIRALRMVEAAGVTRFPLWPFVDKDLSTCIDQVIRGYCDDSLNELLLGVGFILQSAIEGEDPNGYEIPF